MRHCTIEGCEREATRRGWCGKHYQRWAKWGDPLTVVRPMEQHGMKKTPEYRIWQAMLRRCDWKKGNHYERYGGRGLEVCEQWKHSFSSFYADMGPKPGVDYSIERNNNDIGYCKENCVWATITRQANNRSNNLLVTANGRTQTLAQWCRELGLVYGRTHARLVLGWEPEQALGLKPFSGRKLPNT